MNTLKKLCIDPNAYLILYGSYARGDYNENSDLDFLVLIDKIEITRNDQKKIKYPLYDIEFTKDDVLDLLII
ncbi:MAG: nucleotidyltransferase domain-containing protein [Bacteroidota bacterium]|nr:nucleotidyltransferase domain-containing protein [Bacteroidota bacterium]